MTLEWNMENYAVKMKMNETSQESLTTKCCHICDENLWLKTIRWLNNVTPEQHPSRMTRSLGKQHSNFLGCV